MGEPILGLTPEQMARFQVGRLLFDMPLTAEDGLGPIFNMQSRGLCHSTPLGASWVSLRSRSCWSASWSDGPRMSSSAM